MTTGVSAIDTFLSTVNTASTYNSVTSSLSSGSGSFESIFDEALSNSDDPAEKAAISFAKVQYENLVTLFSMGSESDDSSYSGLFGSSSSSSLLDQVNDLAAILDQDNTTPGAATSQEAIDAAMGLMAQSMITDQILAIGGSSSAGSRVDSLF